MIVHIDMDAFYTSIEERDCPRLRGQPLVVGGNPEGRGVVAAANYEARKYGIHSAMPAATARRLCRHALFLSPRHPYYAQVSRQIREIFYRYTPLVEPLSLDEAFLDVTESERLFGSSATIARQIKLDIAGELQLVASVGVAPNKFLAKIASDLQKPDGFVVVARDGVCEFLDPLPIARLWGVGRVSAAVLQRIGVRTIADLRGQSRQRLRELFGKNGEHLWRLARGIDHRPVTPDHEAKSISHETTFEDDLTDVAVLRAWLLQLTEQVGLRLRRHHLQARTINVKIRFADFKTITRAHTVPEPTDTSQKLWQVATNLLETNLPVGHVGVRLLGMGVSGLERKHGGQTDLFDGESRLRQELLDAVSDKVKNRFGSSALRRGTGLRKQT
ncbi:MAG: DNA polymerase IV [Acidiferrobacterales bacterium]